MDTFSRKICLIGELASWVVAKINLFAINCYSRTPPISSESHPEKSRCIIALWSFSVLQILGGGCLSKICVSIFRAIPIDMVYTVLWPSSCHIKPCEAMRPIQIITYHDVDVAIIRWRASDLAFL